MLCHTDMQSPSFDQHLFCITGRRGPTQTDEGTTVTSLVPEQPGECILVDMGAFHLAEFAHSLGQPFEGSAVHGGIHIVQMCSSQLVPRMVMFPRLPSTCKVTSAVRLVYQSLHTDVR